MTESWKHSCVKFEHDVEDYLFCQNFVFHIILLSKDDLDSETKVRYTGYHNGPKSK